MQTHDSRDCSGCKLTKFFALPFNQNIFIFYSPFDLIHSNIWGPSSVVTKEGSRYYISFIDYYNRYCWVYLMKYSSEFFEMYKIFCALVNTQHSAIFKCFRCDLCGKYTSNKFCALIALDDTIHQTSCTDTSKQIVLLKKNIGILLKLLVLFCCLLQFLVSFR